MRDTLAVARGVSWRVLHTFFTNPSFLLPSLAFPLFFFTAFVGGLSRISQVPGFDFPSGYTAFQFVFVLLQSAAFAGVFTGFGIARDFESGFMRRLMLAAPNRSGILLGYVVSALVRWLTVAAIVTVVALLAQMKVGGNGIDLFGLYALALAAQPRGHAVGDGGGDAAAHAAGRAGDADAGLPAPLLRAGVRPARLCLKGWIHAVASVNPITPLLEAGRGLHLRAARADAGGVCDRGRPDRRICRLGRFVA